MPLSDRLRLAILAAIDELPCKDGVKSFYRTRLQKCGIAPSLLALQCLANEYVRIPESSIPPAKRFRLNSDQARFLASLTRKAP